MEDIKRESLKLLLRSSIFGILVFILGGFRPAPALYVFIYFASVFVLPYWLKNKDIKLSIKVLLTIILGGVGIGIIGYFYGFDRILKNYIFVFCVVVITCIAINIFNMIKNNR